MIQVTPQYGQRSPSLALGTARLHEPQVRSESLGFVSRGLELVGRELLGGGGVELDPEGGGYLFDASEGGG
jgi:hypothetical protein